MKLVQGRSHHIVIFGLIAPEVLADFKNVRNCSSLTVFSSDYLSEDVERLFETFEDESKVVVYCASDCDALRGADTLNEVQNAFLIHAIFVDSQKISQDEWDRIRKKIRLLGPTPNAVNVDISRNGCLFIQPHYYHLVEAERKRLGVFGLSDNAPKYSVCVCNYNMEDTLERSMVSVLDQLDPSLYEVVVVDDGSSDGSLEELKKLAQRYSNFRYFSLPRDPRRKLGETRNISIRAARGEYVLLHIDADDVWEPYLQDFVTLCHKIESCVGHDIHISGQQTGMGKRDVLLGLGPFENIYRCEDRNLMMKLAKEEMLVFFDYRVFRTRLSRPIKKKLIKIVTDTCSLMFYEMRQNTPKLKAIKGIFIAPFRKGTATVRVRLLRALVVLPIFLITRFYTPVINALTWDEMRAYQEKNRGNYKTIMTRYGGDPDISFLSSKAQNIFDFDVKLVGFKGVK